MALVAAGGLGSASGNPLLDNLIKQFQTSQDAANNAGNEQYKNLLASVAATQSSILGKHGYLTNAGNQAKYDTQQATQNSLGQATQDLTNRGLGNSTIRTSALAGIQNKGQQSLNNIDEAVGAQKAGMSLDLGKLNADSILSKQNQGPDMSMYLNLIRSLAGQQHPSNMISTAGSINAANAPIQFSSFGQNVAPPAPANPANNYYNAATMGGGLSRPGDQYFGSY